MPISIKGRRLGVVKAQSMVTAGLVACLGAKR